MCVGTWNGHGGVNVPIDFPYSSRGGQCFVVGGMWGPVGKTTVVYGPDEGVDEVKRLTYDEIIGLRVLHHHGLWWGGGDVIALWQDGPITNWYGYEFYHNRDYYKALAAFEVLCPNLSR